MVQQKFETIYPVWKQLIKEPWADRRGLERFEYGAVWNTVDCVLLTFRGQVMSGLASFAKPAILSDLWESINTS
jgi:hypothetical protein